MDFSLSLQRTVAQRSSKHITRPVVTGNKPSRHLQRLPRLLPHASNTSPTTQTSTSQSDNNNKPVQKITHYPSLRGDDFRHPLDQQNTDLLRLIPGIEFLARSVMSPIAEEVLYLENISSSILVGPDQLPSLYKSFTEAAAILGIQPCDLYVRQNPIPNAYTLAIQGKKPFIVVHSSLLDLLTAEEVQSVLAHELGHLKANHGVWLTTANVIALQTVRLLPWVTAAVEEQLTKWLRAAELTCDRAALLVTQDPKIVVSSLMKLAGGSSRLANELNIDEFLRQARSYDEATSTSMGWFLRNAQNRALSHPLPVLRAREIDNWAQSNEYRELLNRGVKGGKAVGVGSAGGN